MDQNQNWQTDFVLGFGSGFRQPQSYQQMHHLRRNCHFRLFVDDGTHLHNHPRNLPTTLQGDGVYGDVTEIAERAPLLRIGGNFVFVIW